jgi:ubiquinone/menaquinone biosynthesis C-methylase UbiE
MSAAGDVGDRQLAPDVCSADHAGWLTTPVRRLITSPTRLLRGLVEPGDTAVDLGCGPGFFTLPLAEMVGDGGSVIAVDLQAAMLERVRVRAEHEGLAARIRLHQCPPDSLGLEGVGDDDGVRADFALAFWMVHEVPSAERFLKEVHDVLKVGGRLLLAEPRGHVGREAFAHTVDLAVWGGMTPLARPRVAFSRAVLLERRQG